jgi:hypothetical protein
MVCTVADTIRQYSGEFLVMPDSVCVKAERIGVSFGNATLTLEDGRGRAHRFIPIGNHSVRDNDQDFGVMGFVLGQAAAQPFEPSAQSVEVTPFPEGGTHYQALVGPEGDGRTLYIGETKAVISENQLHYIPHGKGMDFSARHFYVGRYVDGVLASAGHSVGFDGSEFRGTFHDSKPKFGELVFHSGVAVTGAFKNNLPAGEVQITIPAYPVNRRFSVVLQQNTINGPIQEHHEDGPDTVLDVRPRAGRPTRQWDDLVVQVVAASELALEQDRMADTVRPFSESFARFCAAQQQAIA